VSWYTSKRISHGASLLTLSAVPISAYSQDEVRVSTISNPGEIDTENPAIGVHDVAVHFSFLLIVGVVFPLWVIATCQLASLVSSWFDRVARPGREI
jgi:hypothetical protein